MIRLPRCFPVVYALPKPMLSDWIQIQNYLHPWEVPWWKQFIGAKRAVS